MYSALIGRVSSSSGSNISHTGMYVHVCGRALAMLYVHVSHTIQVVLRGTTLNSTQCQSSLSLVDTSPITKYKRSKIKYGNHTSLVMYGDRHA